MGRVCSRFSNEWRKTDLAQFDKPIKPRFVAAKPTMEASMSREDRNQPTAQTLLAPLRQEIDAVDRQIIALLGQRFEIVRRVAAVKAAHGIATVLPERIEMVIAQARAGAEQAGFDPGVAETIYRTLIEAACVLEENFIEADQAPRK